MFNDDIAAAISMWQDKNHIELLMKIEASVAYPDGFGDIAKATLRNAVRDYLVTYGDTEENE
jgi:hypothetical protein